MALSRLAIAAAFCFLACLGTLALAADPADMPTAQAFVSQFCAECHQGADAEGKLDLVDGSQVAELANQPAVWRQVAQRVADGEMPPLQSGQPDAAARQHFVTFVRHALYVAACEDGISPCPTPLLRLNCNE